MLCTVDDLKERLTEANGTEYDAMLATIIAGFTARANTATGRTLIAQADDTTEYHTGQSDLLRLNNYPIISITSVKESWSKDFEDTNEYELLESGEDYRVASAGKNGILERLYTPWAQAFESVQVIYRGGYVAAGETPGDGETAVPADLREAAIQQCSLIFKRRDDIGLSGASFDGGSFSKFQTMKLLDDVQAVLDSYMRT